MIIQVHMMICDRCGDCDHHGADESEDSLRVEMERQGWGKCADGDVCPDCAFDQEEDEEDEP